MTYEKLTQEAEAYIFLGMHLEAWETLENLPAGERLCLEVLKLRLKICTALEKWEMGETIAGVIEPIHPAEVRESAGQFYLAQATVLCSIGLIDQAKQAVVALSKVWPEGRISVLNCTSLEKIW